MEDKIKIEIWRTTDDGLEAKALVSGKTISMRYFGKSRKVVRNEFNRHLKTLLQ